MVRDATGVAGERVKGGRERDCCGERVRVAWESVVRESVVVRAVVRETSGHDGKRECGSGS